MSRIKSALDDATTLEKNVPTCAVEFQLDYLISKLYHGDKNKSHEYYDELIRMVEKSSMKNKDELLEYLKTRYKNF